MFRLSSIFSSKINVMRAIETFVSLISSPITSSLSGVKETSDTDRSNTLSDVRLRGERATFCPAENVGVKVMLLASLICYMSSGWGIYLARTPP